MDDKLMYRLGATVTDSATGLQGMLTHFCIQLNGTTVEDLASGIVGMAIEVTLHISGCVHIAVQPKGSVAETGHPIKAMDFDIRRLKGDKIKPLSPEQVQADQRRAPSPEPCERPTPASYA